MVTKDKKAPFQQRLTNLFGALGYLSCFISWFWASLFYLNMLLESDYLAKKEVIEPIITKPPTSTVIGPTAIILGVIITILIISITIYIILKVPKTIAEKSKKIVHSTAVKTVPLVGRLSNKKMTKTRKLKLTPKIVLVLKLALLFIPILIVLSTRLFGNDFMLDNSTNLAISLFLTSSCLISFLIQYTLAFALKIKPINIW